MSFNLPAPENTLDRDNQDGPGRVLQLAFGFRAAKALMSAVELDLFTVLSEGPLESGDLIDRLEINIRSAIDFFDVLVALGLLHRDHLGRYRNTGDCDLYLSRHSADYLGDLVEHLNTRMYDIWGRLTAGLRCGSPQSGALGDGGYEALYAQPAALQKFLRAMTAGSRLPARAISKSFRWDRHTGFLDIGTAQGCVPVEIARAHPHLMGGGFDLPEVQSAFGEYVGAQGLSERLTFHAGNFFEDELPSADVLIMGRILHNWGLATKLMLLEKAHRALPAGGALIVYDPMIDEGRANTHALFAALTMLLETQEGFEYAAAECRAWMAKVGFARIEEMRLDAGHRAVIGYKQG
jgi:SAM-dependent methyltransferase